MKRLLTGILIFFALNSCVCVSAAQNRVILTDFRNINLFDAFYAYDKAENEYKFIKIDKKAYKNLSKENKEIYKNLLKSSSLYESTKGAMPEFLKQSKRQRAFQMNNYNLPAANALVGDFQKEKKYSTALYYALKIKKYDKKNKYSDMDYKIGELYYLIEDFEGAIPYLEKNIKSSKPVFKKDSYIMLADAYYQQAKKQNQPYEYYKQALINADKALNLSSREIKALEIKYDICFRLKSYHSAMNAAAALMKAEPKSADYAFKYANCRGALKDKKTELIYLKKAKKLALESNANQDFLKEISSRIEKFGTGAN